MTGHVFVSHGSEDSGEANELAAFIEAKGVKAWIAPRDVRPGQDYSEQLQEAIEQCTAFVVLVTEKANKSPYVRAETEMAFSTSKPIFPVRMSDIKPASGLAFFLKIRHWTDAFGAGRDASLTRLARELQTLAGVPVDAAVETSSPPAAAPPSVAETQDPPPAAPAPPPAPPSPPASPTPQAPAPVAAAPAAAAAAAVPPPPAPKSSDVDAVLLEKAVGPRAAWYIDRWKRMEEKGSAVSWNWAACFLNLFWFAYRKMWLPMFGVLLAILVLSVIGAASPNAGKVSLLLNIAITFVTGTYGNHLYRRQTLRLIAETSALARPAQIEALASRGGVSKAAVWVSIGLVAAITLLLVLATIGQMAQEERARQQLQNMLNIQATDPNQPVDPGLDDKPPAEEQPPADYQEGY